MAYPRIDRWKHLLAVANARWTQAVAFLAPRCKHLAAIANAARRRLRQPGDRREGPSDAQHYRSRSSQQRSRGSGNAKHGTFEDVDHGEFVWLTDFLEEDERDPQYQRR